MKQSGGLASMEFVSTTSTFSTHLEKRIILSIARETGSKLNISLNPNFESKVDLSYCQEDISFSNKLLLTKSWLNLVQL